MGSMFSFVQSTDIERLSFLYHVLLDTLRQIFCFCLELITKLSDVPDEDACIQLEKETETTTASGKRI